jgi:hypothetical protein
MLVLISLAVPVTAAFLIINLIWPKKDPFHAELLIKTSLSIGLGLGLSSWLFFICLSIFRATKKHFLWFDLIFLFIILILFLYKNRNILTSSYKLESAPTDRNQWHYFFYAGFLIVILIAIFSFILRVLNDPHGSWDAWNIYNLGARFIYRGASEWTTAFSNPYGWTLPDYPLLIQGNVARVWSHTGNETLMAPLLQAFLFLSATVLLIVFSVSKLQNNSQGLMAGMVLLGVPFFIRSGASLVADVPLGFYILATVVLYCLIDERHQKHSGLVVLCGVMAGFAAWTKNEGLLLILSIFFARFIVVARQKGFGMFFKEILLFAAGLTPILITVVYYKYQLTSPNILYLQDQLASPTTFIFNQKLSTLFHSLTDISKYLMIGKTFAIKFYELIKWMLVVFPVFILLMGRSDKNQNNPGISTTLLILTIMICGYFTVFLVYPLDNLEWLLETTTKRLFLHLLPGLIFVFFLIFAAPEDTTLEG